MVPLGTNTCFIETFSGVRDENTKIPRVNESPVKLAHHNIADTNLVVDDNVLEKLGVLQNRTSIFALPLKTTKMYTIGSHENFETEKKSKLICVMSSFQHSVCKFYFGQQLPFDTALVWSDGVKIMLPKSKKSTFFHVFSVRQYYF